MSALAPHPAHERFVELRTALGTLDARAYRAIVSGAAADPRLAALARLMRAAQRRRNAALDEWLTTHASNDPTAGGAFVRVSAERWTFGPGRAARRARELAESPDLPGPWLDELRQLVASAALGATRGRLHLDSAAVVPLHPAGPLRYVMVSVDGRRREPFLLDTGAATTVLSARFAERAGIRVERAAARPGRDAAGHAVDVWCAAAGTLSIDDAVIEHAVLDVIDLPRNLDVAGLLSPFDTFRGAGLAFALGDGTMTLVPSWAWREWRARVACPARRVATYWNEGSVSLAARVRGRPTRLLLDTGAGAILLCETLAAQIGVTARRGSANSVSAAGTLPVCEAGEVELTVGSWPPLSLPAWIQPCTGDADRIFPRMVDGYLGVPFFAHHLVCVSPGGGDVRIAPTAAR